MLDELAAEHGVIEADDGALPSIAITVKHSVVITYLDADQEVLRRFLDVDELPPKFVREAFGTHQDPSGGMQ